MYNLTALCTILPHCVQSYRTVALKGEGWALKPIMYFTTTERLSHEMALACQLDAISGPKKVSMFRALPMGPRNGFARIKIITHGPYK